MTCNFYFFHMLLKCQDFMLQGTLLIYNLVKEASTSASTLVIIFYGIQTLGDRNRRSDPVFLFVKQHIPWFLYLLSLTKVLERIMVGHQNWQSLIDRMKLQKISSDFSQTLKTWFILWYNVLCRFIQRELDCTLKSGSTFGRPNSYHIS